MVRHSIITIMQFFVVILLCFSYLSLVNCQRKHIRDIPAYVKLQKCHRFSPNLNKCLLNATEVVRPYLAKGVPEVLLPPIDPLIIPEIALEQGTDALNFKALLKNITVTGLTNYKFSQFDFDVPNLQWFLKGVVTDVKLRGDYTVNGRVLIAPIEGKGIFDASINNCNITAYQKAKLVERNNKQFISPVITNTSIEVGGPRVKLDGLFGGSEDINEVTNRVINENIEVLFEDLKPVIEKLIINILEDVLLRSIEYNIPFDVLYPPLT